MVGHIVEVGGPIPGTVSNRTLAKDRRVLRAVFALTEQLEYRDGSPVALTKALKSDPRTPVILSIEEYERFLSACEGRPMLELFVLTLGETGASASSPAVCRTEPARDGSSPCGSCKLDC